ncbi:MAG: SCO6880 family protein, partial [Pseudonocardiaceae bacterium]
MQSKGVLLGLSGLRLAAIGCALAALVIGMFTAGWVGILGDSPLWVGLTALAVIRCNGRVPIEQLPLLAHWARRCAGKQTRYLVRASAPRPDGTMALPGDAAALRFHTDPLTGAVMVHDPHRRTLTAVVRLTHPAYVLRSPEDQMQRVGGWSRALAAFAASGTCAGVQVTESTLPDPGHGVRGWFAEHGIHDGSWASQQYAMLLELAAPTSSTHRTLIAVSLDLQRAAKAIRDAGRGIHGAAQVLRGDMAGVESSLRAASLTVERWLTAAELAVVIRQAYDPAADRLRPTDPGADLSTAGPVAVHEQWDHLRHDGAYSAVLWV